MRSIGKGGSDTAGNVCEAFPKGSFNDIRTDFVIGQWPCDTAGNVRQAMPKGLHPMTFAPNLKFC